MLFRSGWRELSYAGDGRFEEGGRGIEARLDVRLLKALASLPVGTRLHAFLQPVEGRLVVQRLMTAPARRWSEPGWWAIWGIQLAGLIGSVVVFWLVSGMPVIHALFDPGGLFRPS